LHVPLLEPRGKDPTGSGLGQRRLQVAAGECLPDLHVRRPVATDIARLEPINRVSADAARNYLGYGQLRKVGRGRIFVHFASRGTS
jgi:hypothetical protein